MNTMAIGDKLNGKGGFCMIHRSTGQECSSHSIWAQTAVMRSMELFTHSVSSYSNVHISVEIKNTFLQSNSNPMQK